MAATYPMAAVHASGRVHGGSVVCTVAEVSRGGVMGPPGVLGGHDRRSSVGVASAGKRFRVNQWHPPRGPQAGAVDATKMAGPVKSPAEGVVAEGVVAEGVVAEVLVGVGQTVGAGAPLAVIVEKVEER